MPDATTVVNMEFPAQVDLPALGPFEAHTHVFDEDSTWAIRAALAAERPLLVCGEPGTGKSQLARAAAAVLNRPLVSHVVTSRTEPQDLLWRYDAVARLAEAQVVSLAERPQTAHPGTPDSAKAPGLTRLHPLNFVSPGPLWWVFDWGDAVRQCERTLVAAPRPEAPTDWQQDHGVVALIDEIDKADLDLPNALLECLGNGEFHLPYREEPVCCHPDHPVPLVVITTNRERQLPAAFVRRCLVLELALPVKQDELVAWLRRRGEAHFKDRCPPKMLDQVASEIAERRGEGQDEDCPRPGLAEYLDLLRALANHAPGDLEGQRRVHRHIADFVYKKRSAYDL